MEPGKKVLPRLPGWIASGLMILVTTFWAFWGAAEMYHEGWWGAWTNRLPYLVPIAATLIPALVAFRWPLIGGSLIAGFGVFALTFFGRSTAPAFVAITLVGLGFITDGILKRRRPRPVPALPTRWWRRDWRSLIVAGSTLAIFVGISAYNLPIVLTRVDDGDRSARLILGNGVALVWAPEGPGWNWKQPWGGYPSWQTIALYGMPPLGLGDKPGYGRQENGERVFANGEDMVRTNLCRYLSADGAALLEEPQDIWRVPTTDEVVRSLVRHGENAGCAWQGEYERAVKCDVRPDKESPLWSTDAPVVYYWTVESYSEEDGFFVAYNGTVNATSKLGGNPRHGYRCVRDP